MEIEFQITSCRICLKNVGEISIFNDHGEGIPFEMISSLFNIDIICDVKLPDNLCTTCMENIKIASKTKETIANTEIMLNTYLETNKTIAAQAANSEDEDAHLTLGLVELEIENYNYSSQDFEAGATEMKTKNNDLPIEPEDFNDKMYHCENCELKTETYKQLIYHMRLHPDVKLYECEHCGKEYKKRSKYNTHRSIHVLDNKFICKFCGKAFKGPQNLRQHVLIHETERIFPCPHCDKTFCHMKGLRSHLLIHNEKNVECDNCGKKFKHTTFLKNHIAMRHDSGKARPRKQNLNYTLLQEAPCEFCGKILSVRKLKNHINAVHHGKMPFKCSYCVKGFPRSADLTLHMQCHINSKNDSLDSKTLESYMKYKCDECGKVFTNSHYLKKHKILHSGLKEYVCPHCHKQFAFKVYLERHVRLNHDTKNPRNFVCDICGKVSTDISGFKQHMLAHTGETPYHCKFCDSKFKYGKSLRIHTKNKHDTKSVTNDGENSSKNKNILC